MCEYVPRRVRLSFHLLWQEVVLAMEQCCPTKSVGENVREWIESAKTKDKSFHLCHSSLLWFDCFFPTFGRTSSLCTLHIPDDAWIHCRVPCRALSNLFEKKAFRAPHFINNRDCGSFCNYWLGCHSIFKGQWLLRIENRWSWNPSSRHLSGRLILPNDSRRETVCGLRTWPTLCSWMRRHLWPPLFLHFASNFAKSSLPFGRCVRRPRSGWRLVTGFQTDKGELPIAAFVHWVYFDNCSLQFDWAGNYEARDCSPKSDHWQLQYTYHLGH